MDAQWPAQPPGLPPRVPAQPIPEDAAGPFGAGTARSVAPHVPGGFSGSEATRLLCAGTYLDPVFRRRVIEELVEHEERPVPPSLGIDVVPVLSHALRARRHDVLTALLLLAVWVTFFALGFSGVRDHADTLSTLTEYGETPSPGQFAGLLFVSYQNDPRHFTTIQNRIGAHDLLNEYVRHVGSAIFAIPPAPETGHYLGQALFT